MKFLKMQYNDKVKYTINNYSSYKLDKLNVMDSSSRNRIVRGERDIKGLSLETTNNLVDFLFFSRSQKYAYMKKSKDNNFDNFLHNIIFNNNDNPYYNLNENEILQAKENFQEILFNKINSDKFLKNELKIAFHNSLYHKE